MDVNSLARSPGTIALLVAAGSFAVMLLTRGFWLRLLGPVFAFETLRFARQGRVAFLRCVYAAILLAILSVNIPTAIESKPEALDRLAHDFSRLFLIAQAAAVMVLTPWYFAGAVSDEKENRSLDFLLCTPMSPREMVLGKFAARLLNVFGLILAGIPILAITQLWGGVDLVHILTGFAAAALAALSLGSFSILCSVLARTTVRAILAAYGIPFALIAVSLCMPFGYLASPIGLEFSQDIGPGWFQNGPLPLVEQMAAFACIHVAVSAICLSLAVLQLRTSADPPEAVSDPFLALVPQTIQSISEQDRDAAIAMIQALQPAEKPLAGRMLPPVDEKRPLFWKEAFLGQTSDGAMTADMLWMGFAVLVVISGIAEFFFSGTNQIGDLSIDSAGTQIFFGYLVLPAVTIFVSVGHRLAGTISRERERRTLESLLVLPIDRNAILVAKWWGAFRRAYRPITALILVFVTGTLCGAIQLLAAWSLLAAIFIQMIFVATLALFLSAACRSTIRATMTLFGILLFLIVGTWLPHLFGGSRGSGVLSWQTFAFDVFNPIRTWRILAFSWSDRRETLKGWPVLTGLGAYALASWILWTVTCARFRRELRG